MTTTAAVTNRVEPTPHSHARVHGGVTVNCNIPLAAGVEPWRMQAIQKVIGFGNLARNWDGRGSDAPGLGVRQTAIDFLLKVPSIGSPRVVPTSAGGYHFEWVVGDKEIEVSIDADGTFEALRVHNGVPIEEDEPPVLSGLFSWLLSK